MENRIYNTSSIIVNNENEGESLERSIGRKLRDKEPLEKVRSEIYTPEGSGVSLNTDVRTDRFNVALKGFNMIEKSRLARVQELNATKENDEKEGVASEK